MKNSSFQFKRPELVELYFTINDKYDIDTSSKPNIHINGNVTVEELEAERSANVSLRLEIGEQDPKVPFFIGIEMKADFRWDSDIKEEALSKLLRINAPSLIIGYMRPIVSNITANSRYPEYDIPFINMNECISEE